MQKIVISAALIGAFFSCKQEESVTPASESPSIEMTETVKAAEGQLPTIEKVKKPVQHLKIADITSLENATKIFKETVAQLQSKTKFDAAELHEIHMITYSTEKAIAYFGDNLTGDQKELAQKAAIILEEVHLASEGNNKEKTQKNLTEFLALASKIVLKL